MEKLNSVFNNPELNTKEIRKQRNLVEAGYSPIYCSLIDENNIDSFSKEKIKTIKKQGVNVDFFGDRATDHRKQIPVYRGVDESYVISQPNEHDKFSESYYNCTGIILVGQDRESSEQLSLLTHQNPFEFLDNQKSNFTRDLSETVDDMMKKVKPESVDAILFGGSMDLQQYKESINFLSKILKKKLDFEPTVIAGPDLADKPTSIYFETQNRHLYLVRSEQPDQTANHSFVPSDYPEKSRNWQYYRKK